MKCMTCRFGETYEGYTTVTLNRGESVVVIKEVPAQICENCGEYKLSEVITGRVMALAEDALERNVEIEVIRFFA